jgi:hypothetical protein
MGRYPIFEIKGSLHARSSPSADLSTLLQRADLNSGFSPASRHQRFRQVKGFEVTYLKEVANVIGTPSD